MVDRPSNDATPIYCDAVLYRGMLWCVPVLSTSRSNFFRRACLRWIPFDSHRSGDLFRRFSATPWWLPICRDSTPQQSSSVSVDALYCACYVSHFGCEKKGDVFGVAGGCFSVFDSDEIENFRAGDVVQPRIDLVFPAVDKKLDAGNGVGDMGGFFSSATFAFHRYRSNRGLLRRPDDGAS